MGRNGGKGWGGLGPDSPCSLESSHPEDVNEWMDSLPASYLHTPRLATTYENSYHCPRGPGVCQASWYRGGRQDMSRRVGRTVLNGSMTCETTRWEKKRQKIDLCIYMHIRSPQIHDLERHVLHLYVSLVGILYNSFQVVRSRKRVPWYARDK